jgi:hypothetical protein
LERESGVQARRTTEQKEARYLLAHKCAVELDERVVIESQATSRPLDGFITSWPDLMKSGRPQPIVLDRRPAGREVAHHLEDDPKRRKRSHEPERRLAGAGS